jgi:predicted enzyme related to lactoylglutathione lyase
MKIRATDFIMLKVADFAAVARFYREELGLRQDIYSEEYGWAEFDCGNVTLVLHRDATAAGATRVMRLALSVDDISAADEELRSRGIEILHPPEDHGCCQHLEIADPEGNVVILHHRADGTCGQDGGAR